MHVREIVLEAKLVGVKYCASSACLDTAKLCSVVVVPIPSAINEKCVVSQLVNNRYFQTLKISQFDKHERISYCFNFIFLITSKGKNLFIY